MILDEDGFGCTVMFGRLLEHKWTQSPPYWDQGEETTGREVCPLSCPDSGD